jgi:hypothetical protein
VTVNLEAKVLAEKALRDRTKQALDLRVATVKLDLEARGIGGRVADEVVGRAKVVFDEAAEVAEEHPGVIAGTIAALMLWILRNPIVGWLDELLGPRR